MCKTRLLMSIRPWEQQAVRGEDIKQLSYAHFNQTDNYGD